jgi:hypothetical protein
MGGGFSFALSGGEHHEKTCAVNTVLIYNDRS